jgi:hypothetical protein
MPDISFLKIVTCYRKLSKVTEAGWQRIYLKEGLGYVSSSMSSRLGLDLSDAPVQAMKNLEYKADLSSPCTRGLSGL